MTCHEARELYSALVDEALDAGERAAVLAHVAGCAECRRELERFRRTVALLQGAGPVRAPAGFVDRVLEAAAPVPWYRRLARGLFSPLGVKLPLEAAAVLLVAGIAVYVFQHSPELQQAARHEVSPPPPAASPQAPVAVPPAPAAPAPPPSVSLPPGAGRVSPPAGEPAPPAAVEAQRSPVPMADTAPSPRAPAVDPSKGARPARPPDASRSGGAKSSAAKTEAWQSEAAKSKAAKSKAGKGDAAKAQSPSPPPAQGAAPTHAPATPGPGAPAEPPGATNRARAESPGRDAAGGRTDQASGVAKKTDQGRDSTAAEGKPAESRVAESRRDETHSEVRATEAERRAEGKGSAGALERAESTAPPRQRILPPTPSDPPPGERQGALAREDKSGTAPAAPPAAAPPPAGALPPAAATPPGAASAPRPAMKSAPAPASPPGGAGDTRAQARPPLRQETSAQMALAPSPDVAARLAVPDREAALRALAELLGRAGGREVSRRAEADADALDVLVPRDRYADFLQSLAQVGRLSLEREPAAMPGLVRVILRIVHGGG